MKKFTINRGIWFRGHGTHGSMLLRETDQKMCCLGIYLDACGVPKEVMLRVGAPYEIIRGTNPDDCRLSSEQFPKSAKWLVKVVDGFPPWATSSEAAEKLMLVNDDAFLQEPDREARVKDAFAAQGIEVEFVDGGQ